MSQFITSSIIGTKKIIENKNEFITNLVLFFLFLNAL